MLVKLIVNLFFVFIFSSLCLSLFCQTPGYPSSTGTSCICPIDLEGESCQFPRQFTCFYKLIQPTPLCLPVLSSTSTPSSPVELDSDPSCFRYSQQDSVQFRYEINCQWNEKVNVTKDSEEITGFEYFFITDDFSFASSSKVNWTLLMKFFNFNELTDLSASINSPILTPQQLVSNDESQKPDGADVFFYVDIFKIPDQFYAGGRLYFEVGLNEYDKPIQGLTVNQRDREFLDIYDFVRPPSSSQGVAQWKVTLIIITIVMYDNSCYCLFWVVCLFIPKKKAKRKKTKRQIEEYYNCFFIF